MSDLDEVLEEIETEIEEKIQDAKDHIEEKERYEDYRDAQCHKQGLERALGILQEKKGEVSSSDE